MKLTRLFEHPDAAEAFMRGWLARFHGDYPGLYTVLSARRTKIAAGGHVRRLVIEVAKVQPRRRGAEPEWLVIRWCIDGAGVIFERHSTKMAALARYSCEPAEYEVVFSAEPGSCLHAPTAD